MRPSATTAVAASPPTSFARANRPCFLNSSRRWSVASKDLSPFDWSATAPLARHGEDALQRASHRREMGGKAGEAVAEAREHDEEAARERQGQAHAEDLERRRG